MSYVKASAEVIMLDNQDIMASYTSAYATQLLNNLKLVNKDAYNRLMYGTGEVFGPVLRSGEKGLANLLNDMDPEDAAALIQEFENNDPDVALDTRVNAVAEALSNGCDLLGFIANRNRYSADEEDDSFDSEW